MKKVLSSPSETKRLASELAKKISEKAFSGALVFALSGDLGSGKTTFVQYFLKALGVRKNITSPTFVLMKKYGLSSGNFKRAYHLDCYRLSKASDLAPLGFKEILDDTRNIVLIEWPERIKEMIPARAYWLKFTHGEEENERIIEMPNGSL